MFGSRAQAPPAPGRRGTWVGCGRDVGWGGGSLGRAAHRTQRGWGLGRSPTPTAWTFGAGVGWVGGRRTQVEKGIAVAKPLGCWRRRGSAHLAHQLCAGNRSRRWESKRGSTSHPSHAHPGAGTRGSGDGPPSRPSTLSSAPPLRTPPPRVSGRSFLPLPLRRERRVWGGDCHSPLRALDQYRGLGAAGAGSWSAAAGPERRARGPRAVQSAVPARGCRGSGDATPAPGV